MRTYNIYYLQYGRQFKRNYPLSGILTVVGQMLHEEIEITGIIDSEDDN